MRPPRWLLKAVDRLARHLELKRWAANVARAKAWRDDCGFEQRMRFDAALRPWLPNPVQGGLVIPYPDAFYHVTVEDLLRAMAATGWPDHRL